MKASDFVTAVSALVGKAGYWYGCYVPMIGTEALLASKAKQYPATYTAIYLPLARAWMGKVVTDCVGLIKGTVWVSDFGGKYQAASDLSADGMFAKCTQTGDMTTLPEIPGLVLHKPGHIGVYIGNGNAVESAGVRSGVVQSVVAGRGWTGWGKCHLITYPAPAPVAVDYQAQVKELQNELKCCQDLSSAQADQLKKLQGDLDALKADDATIANALRVLAARADTPVS